MLNAILIGAGLGVLIFLALRHFKSGSMRNYQAEGVIPERRASVKPNLFSEDPLRITTDNIDLRNSEHPYFGFGCDE